MACLIDTSVLFKIFVEEPGSQNAHLIINEVANPTISALTKVETSSALRRSAQRLKLPALQVARLGAHIQEFCEQIAVIPITNSLESIALEMMKSHKRLRTLDAFQIASAISAETAYFATADIELEKIARSEGFTVLNPLRGAAKS